MSTIQTSRTSEKNHVTLTWNFPWKSCSTTHLPFLLFNPKILKAFLKTFPNKMKPTIIMPSKRKKNEARKAKKEGRRESRKLKVKTAASLLNPKTIFKFCFLHTSELCKLIFCIWIRRLWSVPPVNRFVVSFSSLSHHSDQKTTWLASKRVFPQNLHEQMG